MFHIQHNYNFKSVKLVILHVKKLTQLGTLHKPDVMLYIQCFINQQGITEYSYTTHAFLEIVEQIRITCLLQILKIVPITELQI